MSGGLDHLTLVPPVEDRPDDLEYAAYCESCGIDPLGIANVVRLPVRPALRVIDGGGQ